MLFFLIYRGGIRELASTHPPIVIGYDPSLVYERGIYALSMLGSVSGSRCTALSGSFERSSGSKNEKRLAARATSLECNP